LANEVGLFGETFVSRRAKSRSRARDLLLQSRCILPARKSHTGNEIEAQRPAPCENVDTGPPPIAVDHLLQGRRCRRTQDRPGLPSLNSAEDGSSVARPFTSSSTRRSSRPGGWAVICIVSLWLTSSASSHETDCARS